ncbi:hypothetical protein H7F36_05600 [Variovorax sp. PAMC28562]|uniref:polyhydroxyalkanoate granule-associated phasin n=1 Tax=Variovorax sp. PAMC28562 TaxID=2762323 RepID=UPI00164EC00C|nr:polyhydroxyalkanoate granule-associated phasin [Variovorax sp. PAMC28562]QNK74703.1 hypothetical protein H7F36_05600 [Variovorax sp. PAMC28562]
MSSRSTSASPRFVNPLMVWTDVVLKTGEMLMSSGSVIQIRTQRMASAGLAPSAADMAEFQLMGKEKFEAANESTAAMADELGNKQFMLMNSVVKHWIGSVTALFALASSTTPAQAMAHHSAFIDAATRSAATVSQLSSASALAAQRGLHPIHAKATSNAKRLAPVVVKAARAPIAAA